MVAHLSADVIPPGIATAIGSEKYCRRRCLTRRALAREDLSARVNIQYWNLLTPREVTMIAALLR